MVSEWSRVASGVGRGGRVIDQGGGSVAFRDAWNKRKGLPSETAERMYVDALLKVSNSVWGHPPSSFAPRRTLRRPLTLYRPLQILRSFSDRTQAQVLIQELETFILHPRGGENVTLTLWRARCGSDHLACIPQPAPQPRTLTQPRRPRPPPKTTAPATSNPAALRCTTLPTLSAATTPPLHRAPADARQPTSPAAAHSHPPLCQATAPLAPNPTARAAQAHAAAGASRPRPTTAPGRPPHPRAMAGAGRGRRAAGSSSCRGRGRPYGRLKGGNSHSPGSRLRPCRRGRIRSGQEGRRRRRQWREQRRE